MRPAARADLQSVEPRVTIVASLCALRAASRSFVALGSRRTARGLRRLRRSSSRSRASACATSRPTRFSTRSSTTSFSRTTRRRTCNRRHSRDVAARFVGADDSVHPLPAAYPMLRARFAGVIERNARNMLYGSVRQRASSRLSHVGAQVGESIRSRGRSCSRRCTGARRGDRTIFTPDLHRALATIVATYALRRAPSHAAAATRYSRSRLSRATPTIRIPGMIWGAFRPSDDPVAVSLQHSAKRAWPSWPCATSTNWLRDGYGDRELAEHGPRALGARVKHGVERYGRFYDPQRARVDVRLRDRRLRALQPDGRREHSQPHDAAVHRLVLRRTIRPIWRRARFALSIGQSVLFFRDATRQVWAARTRRTGTSGRSASSGAR